MARYSLKRKKRPQIRPVNWKKFWVARVTLVAAFIFLVFYFFYFEERIVKKLTPILTVPVKIKMVVSAYYHPVPKQRFYYTGSYWRDLALNGYGVTFSGKKIEVGHAAADLRYYALGSIFTVPGLWQVVVEDKGSAIRGPRRLDVFVGEGEDGLLKSIEWGKRELDVEVEKINRVKI